MRGAAASLTMKDISAKRVVRERWAVAFQALPAAFGNMPLYGTALVRRQTLRTTSVTELPNPPELVQGSLTTSAS